MAKTYSYDPDKLTDMGCDRMRFELGDTILAPGELTAALCDEEYAVLIKQYQPWKKAKKECLRAILMRFAHQVDVTVNGISYSYAERVKFWKQLLDELKAESSSALPSVNPNSIGGPDGGHYFHKDMHRNPERR